MKLSETVRSTPLLGGEIHLWTVCLDVEPDLLERFRLMLTVEEKKKAAFYKFESVQHRYIVSQATLRLLLSDYQKTEPSKIEMGVHKKGKPFLVNDSSLFFNMSHSHELCVYAFSYDAEVGIDIEMIRDLPDLDQLIEKNLTSREQLYLQADPDQKQARFFQFWTFKESYLKAIGEGMRLTPENLEFSLEVSTIRLQSSNYGFDEGDWRFKGFAREGNYTGTLTYKGSETVIREYDIELQNLFP